MRTILLLTSDGIRHGGLFCPRKQMAMIYDFMVVLIVKFMLSVKQSDGQKSGIVVDLCIFKSSVLYLQ